MERFMDLIYNTANGVNGFDDLGHYLRALLLVTNCVDYRVAPLTGCSANWAEALPSSRFSLDGRQGNNSDASGDEVQPGEANEIPLPDVPVPEAPDAPESPVEPLLPPTTPAPPVAPDAPAPEPAPEETGEDAASDPQAMRNQMKAARRLLAFLMEDGA
jgi:hypothetical protein